MPVPYLYVCCLYAFIASLESYNDNFIILVDGNRESNDTMYSGRAYILRRLFQISIPGPIFSNTYLNGFCKIIKLSRLNPVYNRLVYSKNGILENRHK